MKNQTGKFRTKKTFFTPVSNHVLLDPSLDMSTKALHNLISYFLSIPHFTLYKIHVQNQTNLGDRAFNRMWKQLKDKGYLIQHKLKDDKGIFYYEYELLDQPLPQDAPLDNAPVDTPPPDERGPINNTLNKNTLSNNTLTKKQQQEKEEKQIVAASLLDQDIRDTYLKAFNKLPNAMVEERLIGYLYRFEKDVIILAMEMAGCKQKSIDYVYGILRVWSYENAYTFDEVVAYEELYR